MADKPINQKTQYVITGIIAILISLGGAGLNGTFNESADALADYYICDVTQDIGEYARLSSTLYTAYPNEFDSKGYDRCTDGTNKGTWYGLLAYAEANGLNLDDLIDPNEPEETPVVPEVPGATGTQYECNQVECIEI